MSYRFHGVSALLLTLTVSACAREEPVTEVKGSCADVFNGQICTWATTRGDSLIEAGATVPFATIENAPADHPMAWPPATVAAIDMPAAAEKAGMKQLTVS